LQLIEDFTKLEPIPTPSGWLDAAENQDLLPPPKSRFIPMKQTHNVKQVNLPQEAIKYLMFPEAFNTSEVLIPRVFMSLTRWRGMHKTGLQATRKKKTNHPKKSPFVIFTFAFSRSLMHALSFP